MHREKHKPWLAPEWVVLIAGTTAALHIGKLPPAMPALQDDLGITLVQSGFLLSLVQLAGVLGGVLMGSLVTRAGLRTSVLRGLSLLTLTSLIGGFIDSIVPLLFLRALEGLGFLMIILSGPGLMRRLTTPELLGPRMGWWGGFMGFGTGFGLLIGPTLISNFNWYGWWWAVAAITLGCFFWVKRAVPETVNHEAVTTEERKPAPPVMEQLRATLSHKNPWLISLPFACYSGQWLAVIGFLPTIYQEAGISGATLGVLTAIAALSNTLGNIASGRLINAGIRPHLSLILSFAVMTLMTLITFSGIIENAWIRYIGVLLFSAVGGIIPGTLFYLSVRMAPEPNLVPTTTGWMLQLSALGQLCTPPLLAFIAASYGDWSLTWIFSLGLSLFGIALASQIRREI